MRLPLCILLSLEFTSCKTQQTISKVETLDTEPQVSEFICRAKGRDGKLLHVNATLTALDGFDTPQSLQIIWRVTNSTGAIYQAGHHQSDGAELTERSTLIKTNSLDATFLFSEVPALVVSGQTTPCTVLLSQSLASIRSGATCNAIGTPSQGWYVNGRLVKHSRSCSTEVLACGTDQMQEGWFVQKKVERVRVTAERCSWRKEKPICKTNNGTSAWYLGDRLVARDDECRQKDIECVPTVKTEGWFTFKRSDPQLLVASECGVKTLSQKTAKNRATTLDASREQVQ